MHSVTRSCLAVLVAVLAVMAAAPGAGAQTDDDEIDNIVVVTGRAEVREGETVDNVVIADGPVVVDGTVRDVLVAVHGDVLVRGTAEEDVFALDGRVVVADSGLIQGDVMSRHRPVVEGDGRIDGSWERWNPTAWRRATTIATRIALWIAFTISTLILGLVLGLLAPRAAAAVGEAARGGIGPVIGWGLLLTIGLPVVAVLAMVTIVGLPLGLGLLLALGLVYGIGYTAGAWVLGRTVAREAQPIVAFLAGWGILRVVAIVPILGGLTWFATVVVGLGAIAVAGYRARGRATAESGAVPVASPPPAAPPVAEAGDVPGEP
jgi:hypothetical protein